MIPPIPPTVAAAGARTAGAVAGAAIGRYRPAGVPRTGSSEDRAAAYQRLLDAATATQNTLYQFWYIPKDAGEKAAESYGALLRTLMQTRGRLQGYATLQPHTAMMLNAGADILSALGAVRLRGTLTVIAAAENLVRAIGDIDINTSDDDAFHTAFAATVTAYDAFLTAARTDLGYDTKPYQLLRRYREWKFLRRQAAAIEA
jgi:hypothetical protein